MADWFIRGCGALIVLLSLYIMVSFGQSLPDLFSDVLAREMAREETASAVSRRS